jgi:hypothetical protein
MLKNSAETVLHKASFFYPSRNVLINFSKMRHYKILYLYGDSPAKTHGKDKFLKVFTVEWPNCFRPFDDVNFHTSYLGFAST